MLIDSLDAADSLRHQARSALRLLCRRYKTCYPVPSLSRQFLKRTHEALIRPLDWKTPTWIARIKWLQMPVLLWKLSLVNVRSAIVIAVGSLINTIPIDVLSINTGNTVGATGVGEVRCTFIALMYHRDDTELVLKPKIAKGQGTVSFTFPASPKHGRRSTIGRHLPLGQQGSFHWRLLRNANLLSGLRSITELGTDEWATATMLYGIDRLPALAPMFVYRAPDVMGWRLPPRIEFRFDQEVSPLTILRGITAAYPDLQNFRLLGIDSARGLSTQQSLWHPSYMVLGENSLQRFELRPHGILEVLAGGVPFCFPTVLPRDVNVGILLRFLAPLIPTGVSDLSLRMTLNGDLLNLDLVECLCGFFVQICITGRDELLEDIQNALPLMAKLFHLDTLHLDLPCQERQTQQVHAFIPGGTSITLSRDVVILCRARTWKCGTKA